MEEAAFLIAGHLGQNLTTFCDWSPLPINSSHFVVVPMFCKHHRKLNMVCDSGLYHINTSE